MTRQVQARDKIKGSERPLTKHFTRTARETWREALELSRANGKEEFGGDFQDGEITSKAHPLRVGQLLQDSRGRRQEDPVLSERPIGVLGMGEGKRQRQKGRQSLQERGLRPGRES